MIQEIFRLHFIAEARFPNQMNLCVSCGGQSGTDTEFISIILVSYNEYQGWGSVVVKALRY
jgi:hypothetical protein